MICQSCGIEAPTRYVEFYQNIGLLIVRLSESFKGHSCKRCLHLGFWKMTLVNLFLGWWGIISLFMTPIFIINNLIRYLFALGMDPVPPGARPPELTQEAIEKLKPHTDAIFKRLERGEELEPVVREAAIESGTTPGQVVLYLMALQKAAEGEPQN